MFLVSGMKLIGAQTERTIEVQNLIQIQIEFVQKLIPDVLVNSVHGDGCTSSAPPLIDSHFHGRTGALPWSLMFDRQIRENAEFGMPLSVPASLMFWP
jgi:hypothetical protein